MHANFTVTRFLEYHDMVCYDVYFGDMISRNFCSGCYVFIPVIDPEMIISFLENDWSPHPRTEKSSSTQVE